jgi:hypothetical protein
MGVGRWRAAGGIGLAACFALSCGPDPGERPRPDVLVLIADGLRADFDEQVAGVVRGSGAGELAVYRRAYAPSSLPEQSLAALFTGRLPTHGGSVGLIEAQPSAEATTLAASLRAAGYRTGLVSQASWASRPGYARGFGDLQTASSAALSDRQVAERALTVLGDWRRLDGSSAERPPRFLVVHWATPRLGEPSPEEPERARVAYRAIAEERIQVLRNLVGRLESKRYLDDAVLAATSGSGYELMEHGGLGNGWTLHEEVVRVPLVLRLTGARSRALSGADPSTLSGPVSSVRLAATLHALAGVDATPAFSQAPLPPLGEQPDRAVVAELVIRERAILRAAIVAVPAGTEPELSKYVRVHHDAPLADRAALEEGYEELRDAMLRGATPAPALFGAPKRELLLRLSADPTSLVEESASRGDDEAPLMLLRRVLDEYEARCEREGWPVPEVTQELLIDVDDAAQLEALGYL